MKIGNTEFELNKRTYIMGILNVTKDSFSDGGKYIDLDSALIQAERMIKEGADIIDIGGESTRPGFTPISAGEEIERVVPVIESVKSRFDIAISLDTSKAGVALEGIKAGADLINDITGLKGDNKMAGVIFKNNKPCVLMHYRDNMSYSDLMEDIKSDLLKSVGIAKKAGIENDKIILDPGIGFFKDTKDNLTVLNRMDELSSLPYPWLLGASRKSVIGNSLNLPVNERLEATLALTALAVMKGASFVRVHDVMENRRVVDMLWHVMNEK